MPLSRTTRCRLEAQGFVGLPDEVLAEVAPWLRLAPAICMVWVAVATLLGSAVALWALTPFSILGAILPMHPFDLLYELGVRRRRGGCRLPRYGAPRRFACAVATVWLAAAGWAFYAGATAAGYLLGGVLAAAAALPTFTDFCIPSFFWGLVFGPPGARR